MLVDPFTRGRVLSREEALDRIEQVLGPIDRELDFLQPATNRGWLSRMLQNLLILFGQTRQRSALAAMLELQHLLRRDDKRA